MAAWKALNECNVPLEHLHHGNAAHILGGCRGHAVQGLLVALHEEAATLGHIAPHHPPHGEQRHRHGNEADKPHNPIEQEHGHEERHRCRARGDEVGHLVGDDVLGLAGAAVDDAAQAPRGVRVEIPQRHLRHMGQARLAHVGGHAEGGRVSEHEAGEVAQRADDGHGEGEPRPQRGVGRRLVAGRHGHEVAQHEPHEHERHDGEHAVECRERRAHISQAAPRSREFQQLRDGVARARLCFLQ